MSSNSSREDVRYARSGARDSSCSSSSSSSGGQGQTWSLAPGPQWREELSNHGRDGEGSPSSAVQTGPNDQGHLSQTGHVTPIRDSSQRVEKKLKGVIGRPRSGPSACAHRKRQPKKLRMAGGMPSSSRHDDSSSSEGGEDRQGSPAKGPDPEPRKWQSDEDFKAAVELNRKIVATTSTEEVLSLVDQHGSVFNSVNAATAFHRLAKFGQEASPEEQESLRSDRRTKLLAELVEAKWEEWGGRATNNIAWAHAVLGHGSPTIMSKVEAKLMLKLETLSCLETCMILWAFAKTGYASPKSYESAVPWLLAKKQEMNVQTVTMLSWAYATSAPYSKDLFATFCEVALEQRQHFHIRALSNITWACARVGHYNEELFDVVAARVARRWDDICSFDLGSLAWGLGKAYGEFGVKGPSLEHEERQSAIMRYLAEKPVREQALRAIKEAALHDLGSLNMRTVSNIAYGFASATFWDEQLMDALAQRAIDLAWQGNMQTLAMLLWAFSTLRHDCPALMEALAHRGLELLREDNYGVTSSAVTVVFWAHANLGEATATWQELLLLLAEEACARPQLHKSLPTVAWSLTVAGCLPDPLLRKIRSLVGDLRDLDDANLSQLYQTELAMRLREHTSPQSPVQGQAPMRAEDIFRECYHMGNLRHKSGRFWEQLLARGRRHITAIHMEVAKSVESLGGVFLIEHDTGEWSVDIGFLDHQLAIEVDGPSHFTSNTLRPLGPTLLKRRLLAGRGWEVVSVPYFHWNALQSDYERQLYVYLALQSTSRGRLAVKVPAQPHLMQRSEADEARNKVLGMLQSISSPLPATAGAEAETLEARHRSSSSSSLAASDLINVDASGSGEPSASDVALSSSSDSVNVEEVGGKSPSQCEDVSTAEAAKGTVEARASRLAMLQYKQGRLSKHGLLTKMAQARAAGIAEESSDAASRSGAPALGAVKDGLVE
ncbi:probable RAP domain-containing protein, chloroplastic at C-terminar half [Coccomyxa sp. Obi]|nr:probable RAP domain-containing protein, chloroplastic at C-terminar half [Coccomyxa sp. Obi]